MDFISLFAGIGGFDLGFERAGMKCAAQVEWNKDAQGVLKRHFANAKLLGDVRDAGKYNLPAVDLICGGFPCQDVSVAGRRAGLAGKRSGLWFEFLRIITELEPRWVVIENTPGLLSSHGGKDFAVILQGLAERGFRVCWRVLDAQYWGVAQRRERVFIVASHRNGRAANVLFETDRQFLQAPQREMVSPTLTARGQLDNRGGAWTHGLAIHDFRGYRRLTTSEAEKLQGFPVGWTALDAGGTQQRDKARYKQIGNSVAVPVAEWIGKRIVIADAGGDVLPGERAA